MSYFIVVILAVVSAGFYVGATVVLKLWHALPPTVAVLAVLGMMGLACLAEVVMLRGTKLGEAIILLFAAEVVFGLAVSLYAFGDAFSMREGLGLGVIVLGVGILCWQPSGADASAEQAMISAEPDGPGINTAQGAPRRLALRSGSLPPV